MDFFIFASSQRFLFSYFRVECFFHSLNLGLFYIHLSVEKGTVNRHDDN